MAAFVSTPSSAKRDSATEYELAMDFDDLGIMGVGGWNSPINEPKKIKKPPQLRQLLAQFCQ
jgi:hypothetical protein